MYAFIKKSIHSHLVTFENGITQIDIKFYRPVHFPFIQVSNDIFKVSSQISV